MDRAIVSLSFDDGRGDNLDVFENILKPLGLPATFNITTGYVDGSCPEVLSPSKKKALSVEAVVKLFQEPLVEIALHGDKHLNTHEDISEGRKKLIQWLSLPENYVFGFASPGSGLKVEDFVNSEELLFSEQIAYLRTSLRNLHMSSLRVLCRKAGRVLRLPMLYQIAYGDTIMDRCTDRVIYSIPVMRDTSYAQVKAAIDMAIRQRRAITLMFHSVLDDVQGEDNWSWSRNDFARLCKYLKDNADCGNLEVRKTKDLFHILQE